MVVGAAEHAGLFSSPPQTLQFVSLVFVNEVGSSETTTASFVAEELDCEVRCGDARRVSTESCDDGNLENGDGCSSTCTIENNYLCHDAAPPEYTCRPGVHGTSHCQQPAFTSVRVEASTTIPGAPNQLHVSFAANFEILALETIDLSGLRGSTTPDMLMDLPASFAYIDGSSDPEHVGLHADVVYNPIAWLVHPGIVRFKLARNVPALALVVFTLTVSNGLESQPRQDVTLGCEDCCADSPVVLIASGEEFALPTLLLPRFSRVHSSCLSRAFALSRMPKR